MYRLGQSSLPTEGAGRSINLLTREVNDVRDGLFADLDLTPRLHVLAGGLLVIALLVSPILTVFLASLGLLVWLTSRVMLNRDARLASDAAMRDASVQLCPAPRRPRPAPDGAGLRRRGVRQAAVRRASRTVPAGRLRGGSSPRDALNPSTGLLFGAAIASRWGCSATTSSSTKQIAIATMLILLVSLAGLAYPIRSGCGCGQAIRQANRSAGGVFEFLERQARAAPGRRRAVPRRRSRTRSHRKRDAREPLGPGPARRGLGRDSRPGSRTAIMGHDEDSKLALACLIPRLIDPKVGPGPDRRPRPPRGDARVGPRPGRHGAPGRPGLHRFGRWSTSAWATRSTPCPAIIEAAKVAHAHHFIQDLPHGYDTIDRPARPLPQARRAVPDRAGPGLPARPVDPDHRGAEGSRSTSDTKHFIDDTLSRLSIGRTLIILPHRLSTIRVVRPGHRLAQRPRRGRSARPRSSRARASSSATCSTSSSTSSRPARSRPAR